MILRTCKNARAPSSRYRGHTRSCQRLARPSPKCIISPATLRTTTMSRTIRTYTPGMRGAVPGCGVAGHPGRAVGLRANRTTPCTASAPTTSCAATRPSSSPSSTRSSRSIPEHPAGARTPRAVIGCPSSSWKPNFARCRPAGLEPDLDGMGAFKPMQFQRPPVEWALRQLRPRLLLADAVGLGKTIEVGMILTELSRRGRANRILVLARKSMLTQFQSELWNRFAIPLVRLDSDGHRPAPTPDPGEQEPLRGLPPGDHQHRHAEERGPLPPLPREHPLGLWWSSTRRTTSPGASVPERHLSHRLARLLSRQTDSMLLTTATPHNGQRETFGRLISLLDPSAIPDPTTRNTVPTTSRVSSSCASRSNTYWSRSTT